MTYAIVILNWNGMGFLRKYLPPLVDSVKDLKGVRVVVADNASTDLSPDMVEKDFPSVEVIRMDKNYGFAGGYNKALNKIEADCFLLLNSDVEVAPDWFYPLMEWMELHPECGICGPKLHMTDDRDRFEYAGAAGGYIDFLGYPFCRGRVMKRTEIDEGQYDVPAEVLWVSGAALMIRSSLFFSLGGFCDEFFAHMEEIDLCWRARLEGWKVCTVPRSVVYHVGGGSLPQDSPRKLYFNYRNNLLMLQRCLPKTCSLFMFYNLLGMETDPEEGPDIFLNCLSVVGDVSKHDLKEMVESSAKLGKAMAKNRIFERMLLDGMSAAVYLCTFRFNCFKAVWNAHRDYRRMSRKISEKELIQFLKESVKYENIAIARTILAEAAGTENVGGPQFSLKGMWNKWIVWQSIFKKDTIFARIKDGIE